MACVSEHVFELAMTILLCLLIDFAISREKRTKNYIEKGFLRLCIVLGHLVIIGIIILSILAGISYLKEGVTKAAIILFITAVLLILSQFLSIPRTIKKFRRE